MSAYLQTGLCIFRIPISFRELLRNLEIVISEDDTGAMMTVSLLHTWLRGVPQLFPRQPACPQHEVDVGVRGGAPLSPVDRPPAQSPVQLDVPLRVRGQLELEVTAAMVRTILQPAVSGLRLSSLTLVLVEGPALPPALTHQEHPEPLLPPRPAGGGAGGPGAPGGPETQQGAV